MMDLIEQSLQQQLSQHSEQLQGLWLVDENLACLGQQPVRQGLRLISNRYDVFQHGLQQGWPIEFSDFDCSAIADNSLDRVYYRVSKEKAVVHHLINQAGRILKPGGQLWLFGAKQEGTKTYFDKARKLFGDGRLDKLGKGGFAGLLIKQEELGEPLDDRDYCQWRTIDQGFVSKPGLFGWDKLDQGSMLLADHFAVLWQQLDIDQPRVLDLGCGYGYLSVRAFEQGVESILATDNNAAAVQACQQNFQRLDIPGRVVADDCADSLTESFDLVLCNPPFHQGFSVEGELTDRFLNQAARLLKRQGQAAFVVNRFIPLERKAQPLFAEVETFADNGSFKLVRLARPVKAR